MLANQNELAFCFCCRFWGNQSSPFSEPKGFSNWQHATGKNFGFCQHNTSVENLRCYGEWKEFRIREKEGKHVEMLLDKAAITVKIKIDII